MSDDPFPQAETAPQITSEHIDPVPNVPPEQEWPIDEVLRAAYLSDKIAERARGSQCR
jgi:hypothetical protein